MAVSTRRSARGGGCASGRRHRRHEPGRLKDATRPVAAHPPVERPPTHRSGKAGPPTPPINPGHRAERAGDGRGGKARCRARGQREQRQGGRRAPTGEEAVDRGDDLRGPDERAGAEDAAGRTASGRARGRHVHPERCISQPVVPLSCHPTVIDGGLEPRQSTCGHSPSPGARTPSSSPAASPESRSTPGDHRQLIAERRGQQHLGARLIAPVTPGRPGTRTSCGRRLRRA